MSSSKSLFYRVGLSFLVVLALLAAIQPAAAQFRFGPREAKPLDWRFVGPQGNRVSAVVSDSNDPNVYYAGACAGGVWKSDDGGTNWRPIFDDQTSQSIGSLAIAPSDSNQIWAGTGEAFIRSNVLIGDGIYKSTDAGETWQNMGLEKTGRIGRTIVHPTDPDKVFACAVGTAYGPQKERGVFKTTDGGKNWDHVLFADEDTGCSGLAMDPNNPNIMFAGMWSIEIKTWGKFSGGPGGGVYVSRDGGDTWNKIEGHGLPEFEVGKVDVIVAPSNSKRVYALIETGDRGSLWRSDDGGFNWRVVSHHRGINERPHYYTRMVVAPDDEDTVYFPCNRMHVSRDGGQTIEPFSGGGDNHDMWADPKNPERMMIGNDGGISITTTRGRQWSRVVLPIGQMYHVAVDNHIPYRVYSNMQDSTSKRGPAYPGYGPDIPVFVAMSGCESGFAYPDPTDNDIVWGSCYSGTTEIYNHKNGLVRNVNVWPEKSLDSPAEDTKYRWNWTHPVAMSPHDHNKVWVGSQYVHQTTNGGQSWEIISPDLTLNDETKLGSSGGLSKDNLGVEYGCTLFAIAESPVEAGVIWVGSNDGLMHVTRDGGANWDNVTPADMPPWGTVSMIDPSTHEAGRAYIAVDGHQEDIRDPHLFKTTDYGKTWKAINNGIPKSMLSYTSAIKEDPVRKGLLYAGTANAIYVSYDDGENWESLQADLPQACITWIAFQEHFNDLVVGTNGRGIWIMDDVSHLQQLTPEVKAADAHLFTPRPAYRFKDRQRVDSPPNNQTRPERAPYGASINYFLKDELEGVTVTIHDETGQQIRRLRGTGKQGLNRVVWDLRHERLNQIELRTTPDFHPHVWEEKRFRGRDTRPVLHWGIGPPQRGVLAAPGTYRVKLAVDGKEYEQKVEVRKDPNSNGTEADIKTMVALWKNVVDDINDVVTMINRLEIIGKQFEDLNKVLAQTPDAKSLLDSLDEVQGELIAIEDKLLQRQLHASDPKSYREKMMLYSKLLWFSGDVGAGAGDIRSTEDYGPTDQQLEVYELLKGRLAESRAEYERFVTETIPAFNNALQTAGHGNIVSKLK